MVNKSKNAEKPSSALFLKKAKRKAERFSVLKRVTSVSLLFHVSHIEWTHSARDLMDPLLVTIPGTAGKAVFRNRWKRIVKEWYRSEGLSMSPRQSLWIRFNRNKKLTRNILTKDWVGLLSQEVKKLKPQNLS
jgi:RNase P protein component